MRNDEKNAIEPGGRGAGGGRRLLEAEKRGDLQIQTAMVIIKAEGIQRRKGKVNDE